MNKSVLIAGMVVSAGLALTPAVHAEGPGSAQVDILMRTVPNDVLGAQRGGADQIFAVIGVDGVVKDNIANNTVSGSNVITNGAFTNASGLSTAIMNSGNNVLIQNATILMLDVR